MEQWIKLVTLNQELQLAILTTLLVTLYAILQFYKGNRYPKMNLPPSPPKRPIMGHTHLMRSPPHQSLHKLSTKYGSVILLHLGRLPTVVVSSAEAAKDVMRKYDTECASRPPLQGMKTLTYDGLDVGFSPYGENWREVKKIFSVEFLSKIRVQEFAAARESEVDRLIECIGNSNSMPIKLDDLFYRLNDRIVGTVAFGRIYGADHFKGCELKDLLIDTTKVLSSKSAEDCFPSVVIGRLIDKLNGVAALRKRTFQKLDQFFESIIDKHCDPARHVEPGQEDLVDMLLQNCKQQLTSAKFTKENIKAIILNIFTAGIGTTTLTLLWTFTEIMINPRVKHKLQNEIRNIVGSNKQRVREEDLEKLPYLKMVVKEAIRLHPAVPLLVPHFTTAPIKIGMYDVPEGTMVYVNVWAICRDPNVWENPQLFYPERFESIDVDYSGLHFQFTPFGAGKRKCPAYPVGLATVQLVLANLLYRFNWELPYGMKVTDMIMEEIGGISFGKETPLDLVPTIYNFQP